MKTFTMNAADLTEDVKLTCTLTGTSPDYGTVYVDENMNLIHAPAEADANDTLHLENGILSVETPVNEYELNGNVLSIVRNRLNGSVTAEAWVYTAAPEKLVEFKYDSNGLRTQKKVTDHGQVVTTDYIYHSKKLVGLTCGNDVLHFYYNMQSRPSMFNYNGIFYSCVHNLQGDLSGLVDEYGNLVAQYIYGAWGQLRSVQISTETHKTLAELNPFGYRGYALDAECDLYYLASRYYCLKSKRFVSPDSVVGVIGSIMQQNLFAYSANMPIVFGDSNGKFICTLFGAITGAISGLVTALRTDDDIAACVIAGAAEGAITGMTMDLAATGAGAPISTVLIMGGIGAATGEVIYQTIKYGGVVDYGDVIISGTMGALTEGITFGMDLYLDKGFKLFCKDSDVLFKKAIKLYQDGYEEAAETLFEATIKANRDRYILNEGLKTVFHVPVNKTSDMLTDEMKAKLDDITRKIKNMSPLERGLAFLGL